MGGAVRVLAWDNHQVEPLYLSTDTTLIPTAPGMLRHVPAISGRCFNVFTLSWVWLWHVGKHSHTHSPTALCGAHTTGKHGNGFISCLSNGVLLEPVKGRHTAPGEIAFCAIGIFRKPGTYQEFISRLQPLSADYCFRVWALLNVK